MPYRHNTTQRIQAFGGYIFGWTLAAFGVWFFTTIFFFADTNSQANEIRYNHEDTHIANQFFEVLAGERVRTDEDDVNRFAADLIPVLKNANIAESSGLLPSRLEEVVIGDMAYGPLSDYFPGDLLEDPLDHGGKIMPEYTAKIKQAYLGDTEGLIVDLNSLEQPYKVRDFYWWWLPFAFWLGVTVGFLNAWAADWVSTSDTEPLWQLKRGSKIFNDQLLIIALCIFPFGALILLYNGWLWLGTKHAENKKSSKNPFASELKQAREILKRTNSWPQTKEVLQLREEARDVIRELEMAPFKISATAATFAAREARKTLQDLAAVPRTRIDALRETEDL